MPEKIKIILTNTCSFLEGSLNSKLYKALKKEISYLPENSAFIIKNAKKIEGAEEWDGRVSTLCYNKRYCHCSIKKEGTHFPTGMASRVVDFFKTYEVPYQIIDKRELVEKTLFLEMNEKEFERRDYIEEIVPEAVKRQRGILKMATGSGKTGLGARLIQEIGIAPFIFYVTSVDLLEQAYSELTKFLRKDGKEIKIGRIGNGICDIQDINVMTVQTAVRACNQKYEAYDDEEEVEGNIEKLDSRRQDILSLVTSAKGLIADECQHWQNTTCQVISDYSVSARYRYFLSATPFRDKGDDILIDACCGRVIKEISASFLIRHPKKYLVKPYIYFVPVKRSTANSTGFTYGTIYKEAIVQNKTRNEYIVKIANDMVAKGRTVLILVQRIAHGNALQKMIPNSTFIHGEHSKKQRLVQLNKIRCKKASITISSTIFDEGIDARSLDTLILAGAGRSCTRALQRIGRTLRTYTMGDDKKEFAIVFDFLDNFKYLEDHSEKRRKIYETEPEFEIKDLSLE